METTNFKNKVKAKYLTAGSKLGFTTLTSFMKNSNFKTKQDVDNALKDLLPYALHRPVRRKFPRSQIIVTRAFHTMSVDIGVMDKLKRSNSWNSYFLVFCCNFSNYLFTRALKHKNAPDVKSALESILKNFKKGEIKKIWGDQGMN